MTVTPYFFLLLGILWLVYSYHESSPTHKRGRLLTQETMWLDLRNIVTVTRDRSSVNGHSRVPSETSWQETEAAPMVTVLCHTFIYYFDLPNYGDGNHARLTLLFYLNSMAFTFAAVSLTPSLHYVFLYCMNMHSFF